MATLKVLKNISDERGTLTVLDNIEKELPFEVKRIFYIQRAQGTIRGGHRHINTIHAVICITGCCIVTVNNGKKQVDYFLNGPDQCLIIEKEDWHTMHHFSANAVLLALASTSYDANDYIYEPYSNQLVNDTI